MRDEGGSWQLNSFSYSGDPMTANLCIFWSIICKSDNEMDVDDDEKGGQSATHQNKEILSGWRTRINLGNGMKLKFCRLLEYRKMGWSSNMSSFCWKSHSTYENCYNSTFGTFSSTYLLLLQVMLYSYITAQPIFDQTVSAVSAF